ncbi:hypothetical protein [Bacillus thuringiensis]|uniref:hypothetical protein n=1 Tax=Bacillus thuringiensis TaxID=1428 RepID=UPI00298C105A|nr:hypothetical protein [Bacillus thuringiensis]
MKYENISNNYERIYSVSFILLIILVCSSVIIIGATGGKHGVFLLLAILLNARITKEFQKKYEHYSNKGRI